MVLEIKSEELRKLYTLGSHEALTHKEIHKFFMRCQQIKAAYIPTDLRRFDLSPTKYLDVEINGNVVTLIAIINGKPKQ